MKRRFEVVMAGSGGQGLIVSGIMLGEAAILEGKNVVQTQSYGIATRGGFSKAEVIIDQEEIIFQQVEQPDIILALTEEAMEKFSQVDRTPVLYDTTLLEERKGEEFYGFPFTRLATDLGRAGAANMIALGAMSALTGVVKVKSLTEVACRHFSLQAFQLNIRALQIGYDLIGKAAVRERGSQDGEHIR